jgi:hypothetical protein
MMASLIIPAKAGIQTPSSNFRPVWPPAFAGVTVTA